jgi:hypothetical protein
VNYSGVLRQLRELSTHRRILTNGGVRGIFAGCDITAELVPLADARRVQIEPWHQGPSRLAGGPQPGQNAAPASKCSWQFVQRLATRLLPQLRAEAGSCRSGLRTRQARHRSRDSSHHGGNDCRSRRSLLGATQHGDAQSQAHGRIESTTLLRRAASLPLRALGRSCSVGSCQGLQPPPCHFPRQSASGLHRGVMRHGERNIEQRLKGTCSSPWNYLFPMRLRARGRHRR